MNDGADQIREMLNVAWYERGKGNYQKALDLITQARVHCKENDHAFYGRIFHIYMQIESDHNNYKKALDYCEQALDYYQKTNDQTVIAHSTRHMADLLVQLANYTEAKKHYDSSIQLYRDNQNSSPLDLANALRGYAICLESLEDLDDASKAWGEVMDLYQALEIEQGVDEAKQHIDHLRK